jgi:hypothetical protein
MEIIKAMPLVLPPTPLQHGFKRLRKDIEASRAACRTYSRELDRLFAALRDQAFAGLL